MSLDRDTSSRKCSFPRPLRCVAVAALTAATILAALPAASLAHRPATKSERNAIVAAVVVRQQLSETQAKCQVITVSTVSPEWAVLNWPQHLSNTCIQVAADGVIVMHRVGRIWNVASDGSEAICPEAMPVAVQRDLDSCR